MTWRRYVRCFAVGLLVPVPLTIWADDGRLPFPTFVVSLAALVMVAATGRP